MRESLCIVELWGFDCSLVVDLEQNANLLF